ncbi:divalent-cation tolerance protein CutA [Rhizorhabdus argentea]|uniref:divalent-cation tolerance protein CutA n=1 Tax=Rhizorhabdus argentea TaxID=1387174 RepID=UPI0030EB5B1E
MMEAAVVMTTSCGSREEAERIAAALVGERLAACVQILPATSVYRWRGAIERAEEHVLLIKTRAVLAARVETQVRALHRYELPEVMSLAVVGGSSDYLGWIEAETDA